MKKPIFWGFQIYKLSLRLTIFLLLESKK
jgi:hypothetical protein